MSLELIEDAGKAWHQLWSNRLAGTAATLEIANQVLSAVGGVLPWPWLSWAAAACALAAIGARMIKQPKLRRKLENAKQPGQ